MVRGNDCRCCCQDFALVEVWLAEEDGTYVQQAVNGKGPFVFSGCAIEIRELADGKFQLTTSGNDLSLGTVFPTRTTVHAWFWPVEDAAAVFYPAVWPFGYVYEWGGDPDNLSGSAEIKVPSASVPTLATELVPFALPDDCVSVYYASAEGVAQYAWDISKFAPLNAENGMYPVGDDLGDITETLRDGIEDYRPLFFDGQWKLPAGNVWMVSQDNGSASPASIYSPHGDSDVPQDGYLIQHTVGVGESSRLVVVEALSRDVTFSCVLQRTQPQGDEDTTVLVTAFHDRVGWHGLPFARFPGSDLYITHNPLRASTAAPGFSQHPPVNVGGQSVTIYRDGTLVASGIVRPTESDLADAMSEEGSYLIVSDITEDTNPESYAPIGSLDFEPIYYWRYHRQFASMVVDTTRPLVGFVPVDDAFADDFEILFGPPGVTWFSSEPILPLAFPTPTFEGLPYTYSEFGNTTPPADTYRIYAYYAEDITDRAGNHPLADGYQTLRIHPVPSPSDRKGARGRLRMLGASSCGVRHVQFVGETTSKHDLQTGFVRDASLEQAELTLNRRLAPDSVQVAGDQFTLTANGETVIGEVTVTPTGSQKTYVIGLPEQPAGSVCVLTWTPPGGMTSHDVREKVYALLDNFPPHAEAKWKVRYVDAETGKAYTRGSSDYVELDNPTDNPRDASGVPYDPEPCVLACRLSWIVLPADPAPELIDTSVSSEVLIGRCVSADEATTEDCLLAGQTAISLEGGTYANVSAAEADAEKFTGFGTFSDAEEEGFVPSVPPQTLPDPCPRYGYWGVPTTISPAPPGVVSPCAGPTESQPHSSVVQSDSEITELEVFVERIDEEGAVVTDQPLFSPGITPFADGGQPSVLEAIGFDETVFTFSDQDDRGNVSQNTWVCNAGPGGDGIRIPTQYSWPSYRIDVDPDDPFNDASHTLRFPWHFEKTVTTAEYEAMGSPGGGDVIDVEAEHWTPGFFGSPTPAWVLSHNSEGTDGYYTVRQLKGAITQDSAYGFATAYRLAQVYERLSTAVMSELLMRVSINVVLRAELNYEDRRSYAPEQGKISNIQSNDGLVTIRGSADTDDGDVHEAWSDMEVITSKTLNNRAIRNAFQYFVFSKEQEAALAAGDTVQFIRDGALYGPKNRWNIKATV